MSNLKIKIAAISSGVPCGSNVSYSGGVSYPTEKTIQLGSNSGDVRINFQAYGVPDRLVAFLDNIQVLDTGYIGSPSHQTALNSWLNQNNEQPQTITNNFNSIIQYYITKTSTNPQNLILKIYAPLSGTAWDVFVDCPKPTNHLPIPNDFTINGNPSSQYIFTASDFLNHYSDLDGDTLKGIIIIDAGNGFSYNNNSTYNRSIIPLQDIIDGKLKYNFPSTSSTSQIAKWRAVDINDGITNINNMATITMINLAGTCDIPVLTSITTNANTALTVLKFTMQNTSPVGIEYQVATESSSFTSIILTGVSTTINTLAGGGYSIDIPFNITPYQAFTIFVRIRKKCTDTNVSDWSAYLVTNSPNTSWGSGVGVAPYSFNPVVVIPGNYVTPILNDPQGTNNYSICMTGNSFTALVKIDTELPQAGTQIFLKDGVTKAIPGSIPSDYCGVAGDLNVSGIKWIRFTGSNPAVAGKIWDVNPSTGKIIGQSTTYNCN